jgi:hypothetical protein
MSAGAESIYKKYNSKRQAKETKKIFVVARYQGKERLHKAKPCGIARLFSRPSSRSATNHEYRAISRAIARDFRES